MAFSGACSRLACIALLFCLLSFSSAVDTSSSLNDSINGDPASNKALVEADPLGAHQVSEGFSQYGWPLVMRSWCLAVSIFSSNGMTDCPAWDLASGNGNTTQLLLTDADIQSTDGSWSNQGGTPSLSVGLFDGFVTSLSMIVVSEIGDETFIIAALMAMRHPRGVVLAGALSALAIMTVLSTGLGFIVPNLISRKATNSAATILYTFFGLRLLYIAWRADAHDTPQKELEEVEGKLEETDLGKGKGRTMRRFFSRFCTPIFLEAFILTFLAEWGDRSQIATIALAAHKNPVGVTIGATLGHTICTTLAVVGGRLLALRISQRTVASVGGLLFLVFALHSFFNPPL